MNNCPCGFQTNLDPRSADFHRAHRDQHLTAFPDANAETRASLDTLVNLAERGQIHQVTVNVPADHQAVMERAKQVFDLARSLCGGDADDIGAVLCCALVLLAATDDVEHVTNTAIQSMNVARERLLGRRTNCRSQRMPS